MGEVIKLRVASSEEVIALQGASGPLAVEAVSPRVSFTRVDGGTQMDITDVDGTKSVIIPDGKDGENGLDGASIKRVWINSNSELIVEMTNDVVYISNPIHPYIFDEYPIANSENPVKSGGIKIEFDLVKQDIRSFYDSAIDAALNSEIRLNMKISQKQDILMFDSSPTTGSENPVKSGGIKSAIDSIAARIPSNIPTKFSDLVDDSGHYTKPQGGIPASDIASGVIPDISGKQDALTFDSEPELGSINPVTSSGIWNGINNLKINLKSDVGLLQSLIDTNSSNIVDLSINKQGKLWVTNVSGADPTIQAASNHRYVCGTLDSLTLYPLGIGITDVIFTSGTTPTVLNIMSQVKWPDWFDPNALEASTTYEINILDGEFGAVGKWT